MNINIGKLIKKIKLYFSLKKINKPIQDSSLNIKNKKKLIMVGLMIHLKNGRKLNGNTKNIKIIIFIIWKNLKILLAHKTIQNGYLLLMMINLYLNNPTNE